MRDIQTACLAWSFGKAKEKEKNNTTGQEFTQSQQLWFNKIHKNLKTAVGQKPLTKIMVCFEEDTLKEMYSDKQCS